MCPESTSEGDYISMTFDAVFVWPQLKSVLPRAMLFKEGLDVAAFSKIMASHTWKFRLLLNKHYTYIVMLPQRIQVRYRKGPLSQKSTGHMQNSMCNSVTLLN